MQAIDEIFDEIDIVRDRIFKIRSKMRVFPLNDSLWTSYNFSIIQKTLAEDRKALQEVPFDRLLLQLEKSSDQRKSIYKKYWGFCPLSSH